MSWICAIFGHRWKLIGVVGNKESVWKCQRCGQRTTGSKRK